MPYRNFLDAFQALYEIRDKFQHLVQITEIRTMAKDGLLPHKVFAEIHPTFRTPWKNTILVGLLAAIVGSITPIDDIGKMVNIGTLLAFAIVCAGVLVLRITEPELERIAETGRVLRRSLQAGRLAPSPGKA